MNVEAHEEWLVQKLGNAIGYGRTMQLCEKLWGDALERSGLPRGGAHSHYCCVTFLVPCPSKAHPFSKSGEHCDWCCGAGRVTKRVAQAIAEAETPEEKEQKR